MDSTIKCPHCGQPIKIEDALRQDVEARLLAHERAQHQKELDAAKRDALAAAEVRLKEQYAVEAKTRQEEVVEQRQQNAQLREQLVELTKQLRGLRDEKDQQALVMEKQLLAKEEEIATRARARAEDEMRLKILEKDKQLADVMQKLKEAEQKSQQGSQQTQGEVLELELEEFLRREFPFDEIRPVPKGVTGADLIQAVRDQAGAVMGIIAWEVKNTKSWGGDWIAKLKHDQRAVTADVAVIVSTVLPAGIEHFGWVDGVWVTDRTTVQGAATALRRQLGLVYLARRAETGKKEKAAVLYEYLTSTAFTHRVEAMVEAYAASRNEIEKEKRFFATKWARQERAVQAIMEQTHGMYGDLQGIIGTALPDMKALELPAGTPEDEEPAAQPAQARLGV